MTSVEGVSSLQHRLQAAVGDRTYRLVGDLTGTHPETVRRYLTGQSPSVEFLMALCSALSINGQWLLTGEGPMTVAEVRRHALHEANFGELMIAVSDSLDSLTGRIDRLDRIVHDLTICVHGASAVRTELGDGADPGSDTSS